MKKYIIIERPLFLRAGILALTKDQYEPRKHVLETLNKGRYKITGEVCFKIGETIGYDGKFGRTTGVELIKDKSNSEQTNHDPENSNNG